MKHVCLAQSLILLKGFACNQNSSCPILSQRTAGAMLETADEVSVEPLFAPLVDLLLWGNDFWRWIVSVGICSQKDILLRNANTDCLVMQSSFQRPFWVNIFVSLNAEHMISVWYTVVRWCFLPFIRGRSCLVDTCSHRSQVITTFVEWGSICDVGMGAALNDSLFLSSSLICGEDVGLLLPLYIDSYISHCLVLNQQDDRYASI